MADRSSIRGIPQEWLQKLNGKSPYGTVGIVGDAYSTNISNYPDWLKAQFQPYTDEGGSISGYSVGGNMRTQDGRAVTQVGANDSNENIIDWSQVWEDPVLGLVTSPENRKQVKTQEGFKNAVKLAIAAAGAYAAGGAAGLWGGGEAGMLGGLEAGAGGAMDMGVGTAEMAANMGSQGLGQAALGAPAFNTGSAVGSFGAPLEYIPEPPPLEPTPAMSSYNPSSNGLLGNVLNGNWSEVGNGLLQSAMNNPLNTARLIMGAASLFGGKGSGGSGGSSGGGSGGFQGPSGPVPQFTPWMGQYQPNPNLFQPVPFAGGYPWQA